MPRDHRTPTAFAPSAARARSTVVGHAVVLGAGMAGLAAAASLAPRASRVTVLEQDPLPGVDAPRKGVPQGNHVHMLLPAGVRALERLLPGTLRDLQEAGAEVLRDGDDVRIHVGGGRLCIERLDPSFALVGATRPLTEGVLRERVRALPNVTFRRGRAVGLVLERGTVTGVRLAPGDPGQPDQTLTADLVADATGRGSRTPKWLVEMGFPEPEEQRVSVDLRYTTRLFRRRPGEAGGARAVLVTIPPNGRRGGVALAVEGGRWIVTLVGFLGEQAATDLEGFRAYARSLWRHDVYDLVSAAEPLGDALTGAYPANAWRRYDRLARFPGRFVVLGDAMCPYNPTYAQGMSMAAMEAHLLGRVLDDVGPDRLGPAFFGASRGLVAGAWTQATDQDLRHPEVEGPRTPRWRLLGRYGARLLRVARRDPKVARAFFEVMCLLAPGPSLLRPEVALRVWFGGGARARRRLEQPASGLPG